ncbi:hypothetical protein D6779_11670 [Candidatus Parcubacteria bacterium]|nr:MAG: hypothetical protein D6779_11670 [Candidatus Parcubacteria bacterium]
MLDIEALQEDLRKLALALLIAALASALLKPEESDIWHIALTVAMGMVLWGLGLIRTNKRNKNAS